MVEMKPSPLNPFLHRSRQIWNTDVLTVSVFKKKKTLVHFKDAIIVLKASQAACERDFDFKRGRERSIVQMVVYRPVKWAFMAVVKTMIFFGVSGTVLTKRCWPLNSPPHRSLAFIDKEMVFDDLDEWCRNVGENETGEEV